MSIISSTGHSTTTSSTTTLSQRLTAAIGRRSSVRAWCISPVSRTSRRCTTPLTIPATAPRSRATETCRHDQAYRANRRFTGLLAALLLTLLQSFWVAPLILQAETYENPNPRC
jgi:hypothetical protein